MEERRGELRERSTKRRRKRGISEEEKGDQKRESPRE